MTRFVHDLVRAGTVFSLTMAVTGCGSMSGLDANSSFACKAPDGILCESMSGIYANGQQKNLPGQRVHQHATAEPSSAAQETAALLPTAIASGTPVRTIPRVMRIWFAPWEDSDGDLHDQSYLYLTIDRGHWLIEHQHQRIIEAYRPVRAPASLQQPVIQVAITPGQSLPATPPSFAEESIGIRQQRPDGQAASDMLNGITTPSNPAPVE
jgi:conjugal transfer pilus assembly protein TraV